MAIILTELKLNQHEKKVNNFVPRQAKCVLEKLEKDGEVNAKFLIKLHAFTRNVNHSWMFVDMPTKV